MAVSLLAGNRAKLDALHGILIGCTILSALVTFGYAGQATLRKRARVPSAAEVQSRW